MYLVKTSSQWWVTVTHYIYIGGVITSFKIKSCEGKGTRGKMQTSNFNKEGQGWIIRRLNNLIIKFIKVK